MVAASTVHFGQDVYLRSLTGYLVGQYLLEGYRRIAVIALPDRPCVALAAATVASFIAKAGYREGVARVFVYREGEEDNIAREVSTYAPDAVYLALGGEYELGYVREVARRVMKALARASCRFSLVVHVRVWLATERLSTVIPDPEILECLKTLREIRAFTADIPGRKLYFTKAVVENSKLKLEKIEEIEMTEEHANLLSTFSPPAG